MHRNWPLTARLLLLVVLAAGAYFGGRYLVTRFYPLEYCNTIFLRAEENGLDPYLVAAVIRTESHFRPRATSKQGARGLMQIMPETGEWIAGQMGLPFHPDMLYDPDYNVQLGCWYLANLHEEFSGDLVLVLAAYNGGRSNVQRWLREQHWTGEAHTLHQVPFQETQYFIRKVLRDFDRYRLIYESRFMSQSNK